MRLTAVCVAIYLLILMNCVFQRTSGRWLLMASCMAGPKKESGVCLAFCPRFLVWLWNPLTTICGIAHSLLLLHCGVVAHQLVKDGPLSLPELCSFMWGRTWHKFCISLSIIGVSSVAFSLELAMYAADSWIEGTGLCSLISLFLFFLLLYSFSWSCNCGSAAENLVELNILAIVSPRQGRRRILCPSSLCVFSWWTAFLKSFISCLCRTLVRK